MTIYIIFFTDVQKIISIASHIKIGNVILNITDISHDGTVSFSVQQGELYNEEGETIDADTIFKDAKSNYKLHNGFLSLNVTSNRYQ